MQVQAFSITGDKSRFERDYEPCFAYGDLVAPTPDVTPYPTREVRPTRTIVAWDYPLSFDFRFNLWCGAGILLRGPVRDGMNERTIAEVGGHIERKIGAEADLLGIFPEHLTTMQGEAVTQIAYEFERAAETGRIDEMSYDPAQCFFIGAVDMLNELLPES